jgi:D-alanyl-D-alanine carboxypeptidase/D-alanyl-D-alanine-endopeptidase (penicillin-binding protein 4)
MARVGAPRLLRWAGAAFATACVAVPAAHAAPVGPTPGLPDAARAVMNQPPYKSAQWFLSVRDLATGAPVVSLNVDTLAQPASVTKTYSMGAGWLHFGSQSRVTTPVKRTGRVAGGTLRGDLVLVGKGDITMGGRTKADGSVDFTNLDHNDANKIPGATLTPQDPLSGLKNLARQVRASGVRRVSGDVIVDDRLWDRFELEDEPVTPIVVNNNLIDFTTRPGRPGRTASIVMRPKVAPWTVTSEVRTVARGGDTEIRVTSPAHGKVVLTGTIAADSDPVINTYAFDDPARYARTAFIEALRRAGVTVTARSTVANPERRLPAKAAVDRLPSVARLRSLPLREEAKYVLKVSYNRGGQTMICRLAVAAGSTDCDAGLAKARRIWRAAGLDPTGAVLIDGSGLSGNLVTAENQVQLQAIMARRPDAAAWQAALPILGVDGSLAQVQRGSPAVGKVYAKTGTLGGFDDFNERFLLPTKALGGVMDTADGRRYAFAIFVANSLFTDLDGVFAANDDVGKVAALIQQAY